MRAVWLPPGRGKGAFAKSTEMQWNVPWDPQGSTFFQQIKLFEFLSFKGSVDIFAALFFALFIACLQYMAFHMKHFLLLIGWSALFSL